MVDNHPSAGPSPRVRVWLLTINPMATLQ